MRSTIKRIDIGLDNLLKETSLNRIRNNIDKKQRTLPELTRMMQKCPSFNNLLKELSTIPKREDITKLW